MNAEMNHKNCPICQRSATIGNAELEGDFPTERLEVHCEKCGDYHVLETQVSAEDNRLFFKNLKDKTFDVEKIAQTNNYARSEGKVVLWLNSFDEVNIWEELVSTYAEHYGGYRPYVIEVIEDHVK